MRNILALIGGLIAMFSTVPYIIDIFRHKTRPNIVTWLTWSLLASIATAAAFAAHQPRTALLGLGGSICTFAVVLAGIKHGIAKFTVFDAICQVIAVMGLLLWYTLRSPQLAILVVVGVDLAGMVPSLRHCWRQPDEETWQTYAIAVIESVFTLSSLMKISIAGVTYPFYLLVANSALTLTIIYRRKILGISLSRKARIKNVAR